MQRLSKHFTDFANRDEGNTNALPKPSPSHKVWATRMLMKIGYKFYRNNLIKLAILSVGCLGIFWDHLHGRGNPDDEPGALILVAVLMVVGNTGLFIAMRRAKR